MNPAYRMLEMSYSIPEEVLLFQSIRDGLWLELTIQNYSIRADEVKISQLNPVFLPGLSLAGKCKKTIDAIIHHNRHFANPEMYFVMPGQTEKAKNVTMKKTESRVGHIDLMGYRGKEWA